MLSKLSADTLTHLIIKFMEALGPFKFLTLKYLCIGKLESADRRCESESGYSVVPQKYL